MAAFTVIDHQELGASEWAPSGSTTVSSWTKSSIPSTYDHLLILCSTRMAGSTYMGEGNLAFNGVMTASEYSLTRLGAYEASGSSTVWSARNTSSANGITADLAIGVDQTADYYTSTKIWVPNYAGTVGNKQVLIQTAAPSNVNTDYYWTLRLHAGLWAPSTPAAIHTCTLTGSSDYAQYTTITLYGVKGA